MVLFVPSAQQIFVWLNEKHIHTDTIDDSNTSLASLLTGKHQKKYILVNIRNSVFCQKKEEIFNPINRLIGIIIGQLIDYQNNC